jgi:hypothetical protein
MKKKLLILCMLLVAFGVRAQVLKTVNVTTAGTLSTLLTPTERTTVTNLTVTGTIDATDFKTMKVNLTALKVIDLSGVNVVAYTGTGGPSIFSSDVVTYPANEVPGSSFYNCTKLTTAILPSTATSIGSAFNNCTSLTSVTFPAALTSIGDGAFYQCTKLTTVVLPNMVTSIGNNAFQNCSSLTSLNLPASLTSIGDFAFYQCSVLEFNAIPGTVTYIGSGAFQGCHALKSIIIPPSISSIYIQTFWDCTGLTSITIPSSVTSIDQNAFYNCTGLSSVTIPSSVTRIGSGAFQWCTNLSSIYSCAATPLIFNASVVTASTDVFKKVPTATCKLYVPKGSKAAYQAADQWKDFANIIEVETKVNSFAPTIATQGDIVTITGTDFTGATAVSFGGVAATSFTVVSPTSITAVVGSGASGDVSVTTPYGTNSMSGFTYLIPQTITFNTLSGKIYGDDPFTLLASTTSGLSINYQSDNTAVATISGNTLIIVGAGTAKITASQSGNSSYAAATSIVQSLTVSKAPQTITFGALTNKTYGDAQFLLSATATSGLNVSYQSNNTAVATVSNNIITIVGAGTANITASQSGNNNYAAASNVVQTITVSKANQSIVFGAIPNKTYSDSFFVLPEKASSGLKISYQSDNTAVVTISGDTAKIVGVGAANITASQSGNNNYVAASNVVQALTVSKANQSIAFGAIPNKTYSDYFFVLPEKATSGLKISYKSDNTSVATISGDTVTIVGVGTANITASQAGNTNYTAAADIVQTLTVSKANQSIAFEAIPNKTYGDSFFTLPEKATSGLKISYKSDNSSVVTISGDTAKILGVGTANITASQSGNSNYFAASDVTHLLTVNKVTPVITWSNPSDITSGSLLSATQLNATANVAGTFTYTPAIGAKLEAGNNQQLSVSFTPTDTTIYNTTKASVSINVKSVTGISETKGTSITVYPNPASTGISVIAPTPFASIEIRNLNGQTVVCTQTLEQTAAFINIENLANGEYILVIKDKQGKLLNNRRFIKAK